MFKFIAYMIGLAAIANSIVVAGDPAGKSESAEAAQEQLRKMRAAAGTLSRFEAEFFMSEVDTAWQKDERSRSRVYADAGSGYLIESLPCVTAHMTARRADFGQPCEMSAAPPRTWLCVDGTCTCFNDDERTYATFDVRPKHFWHFLAEAPRQMLPPWFDPQVDWKDLESRYRVKRASSTTTEFFVELARDEKEKAAELSEDNRLNGSHMLVIDRRTCLPKKWRMSGFPRDLILVYTRFDLKPPKRELKVSRSGYHAGPKVVRSAPRSNASPDDAGPFQTLQFIAACIRFMTCCPL
jgi:hypothetical protein